MKHADHGNGNGADYSSGDMRGAHLKLAQRHHTIAAGQFRGRRKIEHEFSHPGVVGQLAVCFTPSTALPVESRMSCVFPDHGWKFPSATINAVLKLPQGLPVASLKTTYAPGTRTLEFTLVNEAIPADTSVVIFVSGVSTPEAATPSGEVTVTSYEKLVMRNTAPASTRGGQILDGPTIFTIVAVPPGELGGAKRWQPFSCCPGAVSDVSLSFVNQGCIPMGGKILVEMPAAGWDMDDSPRVLLRTKEYHNNPLTANWRREQHTLEIDVGTFAFKQDTPVILTIAGVKNPPKETMNLGDPSCARAATSARVTTLVASGGVVDGPTRIEVARISELRESDFEVAKHTFDDACAAGNCSFISFDKLPELIRRTGIALAPQLYTTLVTANLPVRMAQEAPATTDEVSGDAAVPSEPSPLETEIMREEFLNLFAQLYAPAYKFGQELRLACGRGEVDVIREYISRGCDPNAKDGSGWAALHYAADYGQLASIECLLEAMLELKSQSTNPATVTELEINIRDLHGWTPLMCAAANGHSEIVQKLLALGGDLSIASKEGRTALHWTAIRGMDATVSALLAAGADKDRADRCGWTPLHCASLHGNDACAQLLLAQGANQDTKDKLLYTAAKYAVVAG